MDDVSNVPEYHKISGPFKRHLDGPRRNKLIPWRWTKPEFEFLRDVKWRFTEKVDGTNVRVVWDGHRPVFMGRTANSQMPTRLSTVLQTTFTEELLEEVFEGTPAILYGEGYGAGIQKGGRYRPDVAFILFDVRIGNMWLDRENIVEIAESLGIEAVPVVSMMSLLSQIRAFTEFPHASYVAKDRDTIMEGIVGTPLVQLLDRRGGRIVVKLKTEDLYGLSLAKDITTLSVDLPMAA